MLLEQRKQKLIDKQNEQYQGIRIQISKEKNVVKHLTENLQLDGTYQEIGDDKSSVETINPDPHNSFMPSH